MITEKRKDKRTHHSIEVIPRELLPLVQIISSEMFATRRHHKCIIIIITNSFLDSAKPLKASDVLNRIGRREHGVFPGSLLAPAPPGVSEEVDVGGPEGEAGLTQVEHGAGLAGDGGGGAEPEGAVEGGG